MSFSSDSYTVNENAAVNVMITMVTTGMDAITNIPVSVSTMDGTALGQYIPTSV